MQYIVWEYQDTLKSIRKTEVIGQTHARTHANTHRRHTLDAATAAAAVAGAVITHINIMKACSE